MTPDAIEREIVQLHQFFADWFTGRLAADQFARCEQALADGFRLISPAGVVSDQAPLLAEIRAAHGGRQRFDLWVSDVSVRLLSDELALATYHEHQRAGDQPATVRISTALFRAAPAPNGVVWLHVHETWLPPAGESR